MVKHVGGFLSKLHSFPRLNSIVGGQDNVVLFVTSIGTCYEPRVLPCVLHTYRIAADDALYSVRGHYLIRAVDVQSCEARVFRSPGLDSYGLELTATVL